MYMRSWFQAREKTDAEVLAAVPSYTAMAKTGLIAAGVLYFGLAIVHYFYLQPSVAAIMFPLAMNTAAASGMNPMPFVIVVMIGASCGFATPIGYQTNLMVYGPGGYKFSDYLRVGIPLDILVGIVTVIMTPLVYPLR